MSKSVVDRIILNEIYKQYHDEFINYDKDASSRDNKIYVPVDCTLIAKKLGVDPEILFGRLYYHLDQKYGYNQDDGSKVNLFALQVGSDRHVVHFPLLSGVVADLNQSYYRFSIPLVLSTIAVAISIASYMT